MIPNYATLPTSFLCVLLLPALVAAVPAAAPVERAKVTGTSPAVTYGVSQTVPVSTITTANSIVQKPSPPAETPNPATLGYICSTIQTEGNPPIAPILNRNPSTVGTPTSIPTPKTTYAREVLIQEAIAPLQKRSTEEYVLKRREASENWQPRPGHGRRPETQVEDRLEPEDEEGEYEVKSAYTPMRGTGPSEDRFNELKARQTVANIFTPIQTSAPPNIFPRRTTHPQTPKSWAINSKTKHTNKFYSNLFLGSQNAPVYTYPYELWWSNQENDPWGFSFDHREPEQRGFGPTDPTSGEKEYYINPIWIRSLSLSAKEFSRTTSTMELILADSVGMSARAAFFASKAQFGTATKNKVMEVPMCQGMGFITAVYYSLTPVFHSSVLIRSLTKASTYKSGAVKYKIVLENNSVWNLYAWKQLDDHLDLKLINNGRIEATKEWSGVLQFAKVSKTTSGNSAAEAVFDAASGAYCKDVTLTGSTSGSTGYYQFTFSRGGYGTSEALMYALPHHTQSFESTTAAKVKSALKLYSPTKGEMTGVVSNQWRLVESGMPTNIGWLPVKSGGAAVFSADALNRIAQAATTEMAQDMSALSNSDRNYFNGKALAKFAYICLTTSDILKSSTLTLTCLNKLKTAFGRFTANNQQYPYVYESSVWGGIISNAVYTLNDPQADFGSGYYNDHHFHYSYFIQAAAIIAYLDKKYATGSWLTANREWVNTLVRDVANPSASDTYFPMFRNFDWFHGHSWAKGIFESLDGKDEESSSEDYNFAYAMKLWGKVNNDAAMEARGNLMCAILKRSINNYMLLASTNTNHPASFTGNKVTGILWENKVHHTTYFGNKPEHIQGIHMLPLTPMSPYVRNPTFVLEEWNKYFTNGRTQNIVDGWRGVLFSNVALYHPVNSYNFFKSSDFNSSWLDDGASRTWYLAFAGALGGAS